MSAIFDSPSGPQEGQAVQVRVGSGAWQPAVYRGGRFIDRFGLPLDPQWISAWEALEEAARPQ
jgi:hypothetical protein